MGKLYSKAIVFVSCVLMLLSFVSCATSGETAASDSAVQAVESVEAVQVPETGKEGKRIYFAGPMFSQGEKDYNLKLTHVLEEYGYEVFLPQRDGIEAALLEGLTMDEMVAMIFAKDESEILKADIVFFLVDGRVPDEGACVELGLAYAYKKRCYGFMTDTRSLELGLELNPLISGAFIKLFKNYDGEALIAELRQYLSENEL